MERGVSVVRTQARRAGVRVRAEGDGSPPLTGSYSILMVRDGMRMLSFSPLGGSTNWLRIPNGSAPSTGLMRARPWSEEAEGIGGSRDANWTNGPLPLQYRGRKISILLHIILREHAQRRVVSVMSSCLGGLYLERSAAMELDIVEGDVAARALSSQDGVLRANCQVRNESAELRLEVGHGPRNRLPGETVAVTREVRPL